MTSRHLALLATGGSLALLLGALAFQHVGGLAPCKMCIWQRWPHAAAVLLGAVFLLAGWRPALLMAALAALVTAGIGAFHAGVEQGWWEGPTTCTSGPVGNLSAEELMDQILTAPLVRCDEIAWSLAGISMAGWNAILSMVLVIVWLMAARRG
ncbi:disulfide bond formation protein B [Algicella marina]|uniref:Disulfide bond formation protein B n=1 Tax=Algicella marina TaxID=2683284 RepID=A0A6P1SXA7_9RHOB|nr:disulfide bond formation protein B [Algicella marina]QHQ35088.1 disulfide bond formation protein B [Algicella marina]